MSIAMSPWQHDIFWIRQGNLSDESTGSSVLFCIFLEMYDVMCSRISFNHPACCNTLVSLHWSLNKMATVLQWHFQRHFLEQLLNVFLIRVSFSQTQTVQFTQFRHWLRWWPDTDQPTIHYLNQWLPSSLMHWILFHRTQLTISQHWFR